MYEKREKADVKALASLCLRRADGDCLGAVERLSRQLGLSSRQKLRLRHMLLAHLKPYHTLEKRS